ncbi:hypothetical protein GOP47_0026924 [Adiantum capillus-veneris]|nr:hypothetical protein GOP47_0026924 [Adiantum capillus-veneris]
MQLSQTWPLAAFSVARGTSLSSHAVPPTALPCCLCMATLVDYWPACLLPATHAPLASTWRPFVALLPTAAPTHQVAQPMDALSLFSAHLQPGGPPFFMTCSPPSSIGPALATHILATSGLPRLATRSSSPDPSSTYGPWRPFAFPYLQLLVALQRCMAANSGPPPS